MKRAQTPHYAPPDPFTQRHPQQETMARLFRGAGKPGVVQRVEGRDLILEDATHRLRIRLERRGDVQ